MTQTTATAHAPGKRIELPLGEAGMAYVRHALEMGAGLSKQVLATAFSGGAVFAAVPEGTSIERAKQFEAGGFYCWGTWAWLQAQVKALCAADPQSTFVVEDPWGGNYGDAAVMRGTEKKFFDGKFVDYFVERADLSDRAIEETTRAPGFLFIGFFSRYPLSSAMLPPDLKAGDKLIRQLAENTQQIFVGAYDGEGWVVWRR